MCHRQSEHGFEDWPSMRTYTEKKERATMIEMTVDHVRVNIPGNQRVVVLKSNDVNRYLPIWIGQSEGDAIALTLQGKSLSRPMSHDLMATLLRGLGASVTKVVISEMRDDTFIANVTVQRDGTTYRRRTPGQVTPSRWRYAPERRCLRPRKCWRRVGSTSIRRPVNRSQRAECGQSSPFWRLKCTAPGHT